MHVGVMLYWSKLEDFIVSEHITLELPTALVEEARAEAARTGLTIEDVLLTWLTTHVSRVHETTFLTEIFEPGAVYSVDTPYGNEAAADILLAFLEDSRRDQERK